jgi:hypothetical protein
MNEKFDHLTKSMAQSVTRRGALKQFGFGLGGMALACLGLAMKAEAQTACLGVGMACQSSKDCCNGMCTWQYIFGSGRVRICAYQVGAESDEQAVKDQLL